MALPPTHKALVQEVYGEPLKVKEIPTPKPTPGAAILKILHAPIISYMRDVYNGKRKYAYPTPLVTGTSAIGRVAAVGSDATTLKEGDLVCFDSTIHGRDDPQAIMLMGIAEGGTDASRSLMRGEWRDATFAQYAKVPLENCYILDEERLCSPTANGGLGYSTAQLCWILQGLVPYGGLRSIQLQAGETVIISPATGGFGSAAVVVALAMGARVIAMGRNIEKLNKLKALGPRVETVPLTGVLETDLAALKKFGKADAFFDISPREAQSSEHFKAAILSLRHEGRFSYMGGLVEDLPLPIRFIMRFDIAIKGKWMYGRADILNFLGLINMGAIDLHAFVNVVGRFPLEDWQKAFDVAADQGKLGHLALFEP